MNKPDPPPTEPSPASLLTGELEEHEVAELLARTERDPEADRELDLVADLVAAAEQQRNLLLADSPRRPPRRRGLLRVIGAVVAAAALVLLLFPRDTGDAIPGVETALAPPVWVPVGLRGEEDELLRAFELAMAPYAAGDHATALATLDPFLAEHPGHRPAIFYRAVCLERLGRAEEARDGYLALAASGRDFLADHASWRLAHLLLGRGETERARAILGVLRDGGGDFSVNAATRLEDLERP